MKAILITLALCVACAQAGILQDVAQKLIPSFATGYIIKGEDADPHAAPYIVSLGTNPKKHSHICGGTIVGNEWVLTAAHCISKAEGMSVVAGLHQRTNLDEKTQQRIVDYGKVHEEYSGNVGPNDIAVLHVSEPFVYNDWVKPALLPARDVLHEGETHLYGWGLPKAFALTAAQTLQTVETQVVEWNKCKAALPDDAPLVETNVCSDSLQSGISACNGDSGGPLVKEHENGSVELIGIVSWGYIPCGLANLPSIYTRVSAFTDWLVKIQSAYYTLY